LLSLWWWWCVFFFFFFKDPFDLDTSGEKGVLVTLQIPVAQQRLLVGRARSVQESIQEEHKVRLFIPPPQLNSEDVRIRGPDVDAVEGAVKHVLKVVREGGRNSQGDRGRDGRGGRGRGRGGGRGGRGRGRAKDERSSGGGERKNGERRNNGERNNARRGRAGKRNDKQGSASPASSAAAVPVTTSTASST
jgi:uncharacterized membrane protein YgcG